MIQTTLPPTANPGQLGVIPLIVWAIAGAAAAGAGAYGIKRAADYNEAAAEWNAVKKTLPAPPPPPPPPAPKTREEMTQPGAWTPETARRAAAGAWPSYVESTRQFFEKEVWPRLKTDTDEPNWLLIGGAAVLAVLILRRD